MLTICSGRTCASHIPPAIRIHVFFAPGNNDRVPSSGTRYENFNTQSRGKGHCIRQITFFAMHSRFTAVMEV